MDTQLERLIHGEITRGLGKQFEPRDDEQVERAFIGASREGITPPLMQYFRDAGWELRPAQLDWWRDHVARIALYRALISKLRTTLKMPYVVMKGEPLSLHLFGESLARTVTDLDVLVSADRVHDAIDQLGALGFQHLERDTIRPWAYNQVALRHVDHGAILELHWRIAMPNLPCPKTNDVLQHASHDANKTPTMRTTDLALLLAFHLFQHIGFTKGVFDCAGLVCSVAPEALGDASYRARAIGIKSIYSAPLALLSELGFRHDVPYDIDPRTMRLVNFYRRPDGFLINSAAATNVGAFLEAVSMARFLDRPIDRLRSTARPIFFGPHRVGTFLGRRFGRDWW